MITEIGSLDELKDAINQLVDCGNGNHKFEPYKPGTVKCSVCGKFAKVGYMTREEDKK